MTTNTSNFENYLFEDNVSIKANAPGSDNEFNNAYNGSDDNEYYQPTPAVTTIVLVICGFILFVGIVGNILVMIIIAAVKSMHTTVNKCLFSLAIADLVLLCFLPIESIRTDFADSQAPLPGDLCHFLNFYDRGTSVCSFLIFLYVTIDRYFALCYPLRSRALWSGRKTYVILVLIWLVTLALSYPYIHVSVYEEEIYQNVTYYLCYYREEPWLVWYDTFFNIVFYYISAPIFVILYGKMMYRIRTSVPKHKPGTKEDNVAGRRGRGQVVMFLLIVVLIYMLTQLPITTLVLLTKFYPEVFSNHENNEKTFALVWTCRLLIYLNSAANPIIYFSLSTNFRQGFLQVCCCCLGRKDPRKQSQVTPSIRSVNSTVSRSSLRQDILFH